jgi:7,8-dihydropterin-6-yl-methyl-4-(beta-D-ribofuranosyl)aminobenzene 5'-phosphate synthase
MKLSITTLCENTASFGFLAEWGLSLLVEVEGSAILMDTGMSTVATHNGHLLEVDFTKLSAIVLSHAHVDHTGGLEPMLQLTGPMRVVAHPEIWTPKYHQKESGECKYIGVPFVRKDMESLGASFELAISPVEVTPEIVTSGEVPMITSYEKRALKNLHKPGETKEPDPFADDLSLAVKTENGLVVLLGCAHRGPINAIRRLQEVTGEERIYGVVGGTHLKEASDERIEETIREFEKMKLHKIACAHCTGFKAASMMAKAFGNRFINLNAGVRIDFP